VIRTRWPSRHSDSGSTMSDLWLPRTNLTKNCRPSKIEKQSSPSPSPGRELASAPRRWLYRREGSQKTTALNGQPVGCSCHRASAAEMSRWRSARSEVLYISLGAYGSKKVHKRGE
jgi:hypothetical protein